MAAAQDQDAEPWEPKGARFYMPRIRLGPHLVEVTARRLRDPESIMIEIPLDNAPALTVSGTPSGLLAFAASIVVAVQGLVPGAEVVLVPLSGDEAT